MRAPNPQTDSIFIKSALTDALGNLVRFELLPGNLYDTIGVAPLVDAINFGGLLADKAFDANWIIDEPNE